MNFSGVAVDDRIAELLGRLESIPDPQARFGWMVERARDRPPLPDSSRLEEHLVPGCRVRTWWVASWEHGACRFAADSDAVTLKSFAVLLADLCDGAPPDEIVRADFGFLGRLGLLRHLTDSRQATALRIVDSAKAFAGRCAAGQAASARFSAGLS
jgi:cysteine desulfuration protein SufE